MRKLQYIIIEDNPDDALLIDRSIKKAGYQTNSKVALCSDELIHLLRDCVWDFVVAGYQLPEFNALQALEVLKEFEQIDIPFIVVSGIIGEERAVELIKNGAHDCITKDSLMRLVPVIEREMREAANRRAKRNNEAMLLQSDERYRLLAETSPLGVVLFNEGVLDYFNNEANRLLTLINSSVNVGDNLSTLLSESDFFSRFNHSFPLLASHKSIEEFEIEGKDMFLKVIISAVKEQIGCFQLLIQDVTEEQKNLHEIKMLSTALEHSPMAVSIMNKRGKVQYVNGQFEFISGYRFPEVEGRDYKEIGVLEGDLPYSEDLNYAFDSGDLWIGEVQRRRKDGKIYWVSEMISGICDHKGDVVNYVSVSMDVTQRKVMEQELIQSKRKAEESDHLKSAFLANMSHEIRTPLNSIIGFLSLLGLPDLAEEKRDCYVSQINQSSQQLLSIITNIIEVSKYESQNIVPQLGYFDLNELMDELFIQFEELKEKIGKRHIVLEKEIADKDRGIRIYSDRKKMHQLFYNLIDNSLKFTKEGYVRFGFNAKGEIIHLFVKDSGIGIPADMHELIFQRFRQIENSSVREYGGTGLGLTLSQKIAHTLGGKINLTSEVNKGSVFFLDIPVILR